MSDKAEEDYYDYQRRKIGWERLDAEKAYLGYALERNPDLRPEVDAEYLRKLTPKMKPINSDIIDALEEKCINLITTRASKLKIPPIKSCRFSIPEFIIGFPRLKPEDVIPPLKQRLSARGISVSAGKTNEFYFLDIYWK
jgi:hypothetical protein